MRVGAVSRVITNRVGQPIQGASVDNVADSVRDECEANALLLDGGDQAALLVSCDLVGLESRMLEPVRVAMAEAAQVPADAVVVAGTHTHSGPSLLRTNYLKAVDEEYVERLQGWLVEVAGKARGA
ncbi:MAG: hypothetical protein ABIL09_06795, partial [Gemmatimonadota bacterium]